MNLSVDRSRNAKNKKQMGTNAPGMTGSETIILTRASETTSTIPITVEERSSTVVEQRRYEAMARKQVILHGYLLVSTAIIGWFDNWNCYDIHP
jgi:hypothetical protein